MKPKRPQRRGFTLVEIMIVVVVIGLLATIAIPLFGRVFQNGQNARFMSDLRTFRDALDICVAETGALDHGSSSGTLAPSLALYIQEGAFTEESPIGGNWDVEFNKSGVTLGVGVHNYTCSADQLADIDAAYDNGDLSSGNMRLITGGRYYWVLID